MDQIPITAGSFLVPCYSVTMAGSLTILKYLVPTVLGFWVFFKGLKLEVL
jgi:hypothetical protein